jgi:hypothetical protein
VGYGENSDLRLGVIVPASPGEPLRVTNRLGTRLPLLALKDEAGQLHWGAAIERDATVALRKIAADELGQHWKLDTFNHQLAVPPDLDPDEIGRAFWFSRNRVFYWSNVDNGLEDPAFRTSILESQLRLIESGDPAKLEPGTYWAVAENSPCVPLGYARARQQDSWHLIRGRW